MKYTGRIITVIIVSISFLAVRLFGFLYYDYPLNKFPFIGIIIILIFWWLGKQYDIVKFLSEKDVLTKLYNRRYVIRTFPKLSALMNKKAEKLYLFLIDIDNFKSINDTYGHAMGDTVLQLLSTLLLENTRKTDIVARLAGDEFLIIAPFNEDNGKEIMIRRIQKDLKKVSEDLDIDISVSIGSSEYTKDASLDMLLSIADQNMYRLKIQKRIMM